MLAVRVLHVILEIAELRHFLFDILPLANENLKWQLPAPQINRNTQLKVILMALEAIKRILRYYALSADQVQFEVGIQQVLASRCKVIILGVGALHHGDVA